MTEISESIKEKVLARILASAKRRAELEEMLSDPDLVQDQARYAEVVKEYGALGKLTEMQAQLQQARARGREAEELLQESGDDPEMRVLAEQELAAARESESRLVEQSLNELVSEPRRQERNVIVEIRGGTGGEEAALFAADLFRMYSRYAQRQGWEVEVLDRNMTDMGGFKHIAFSVSGPGAWQELRQESGGHRVQRVPVTESQGRIHTSLATVAVLPEAKEVDVELKPEDLDVSFMRSQGPGGQNVNKVASCVRMVHKPTGIAVKCQEQPSQHKNRKLALKLLRAKLFEQQESERKARRDELRRSQVGDGDRSQRIRTYNFPQDRITDHRIGLNVFGIDQVLMGECDPIFDALADWQRQQRIQALTADD
jgi:peptide chain release factor 1